MGLFQYVSTDLLLRAIGNLEGRDEYFWLYQEAWRVAHTVLGLDSSVDRFSSTDWRLALETDIAGFASRPLLLSTSRSGRNSQMAAWLDEFVDAHWVECAMNAFRYGVSRERARRRSVLEVTAEISGQKGLEEPGKVLEDLSVALADLDRGEWVVVAAPDGVPQVGSYERVWSILRAAGKPVLWVEYSPDFVVEAGRVSVSERAWGRTIKVPLPTVAEVMKREPALVDEYRAALAAMRVACGRLPGRWRGAARGIEPMLPVVLATWFSSRAVAESVLEHVRISRMCVIADKYSPARAFVLGARRRGIPSVYLWNSVAVSAPQYWPISDRILVANEARAERLVKMLGIPLERIQAVGSLEVDELLEKLQGTPEPPRHSELRFALLLKWPAEFAFGRPEEIKLMLSELGGDGRWFCILRPHPKDFHDYRGLEQAFSGRVRVTRPGYRDTVGLVETFAGADLVVAAMGNAALLSIAAGKPTVIYNPDPRINLGHDRLLARDDVPGHTRFIADRGELLRLLRRVMEGEEPELMKPQPLVPSLERYLFHSLDGRTTGRIARALLNGDAE